MKKSKVLVPEILDNKENIPILTDNEISDAVTEINEMLAKDLVASAIKVGNYVLDKFFGDDLNLAMSKNPTKSVSFRKLSNNKDLNISLNGLHKMVRIAAQEKLHPGMFDNLSYSHRIELLAVEDDVKLIEYAQNCVDNNISVRGLREMMHGKGTRNHLTEIALFNPLLDGIIKQFTNNEMTDEKLNEMSLIKIKKLKTNIEIFLSQVDSTTTKLNEIKAKIEPIFEAKNLKKI